MSEQAETKRLQLIRMLGNKCAFPGCPIEGHLLDIEHKFNDGAADRERFNNNSDALYQYYLDHPDEAAYRLQLLCGTHHDIKHRIFAPVQHSTPSAPPAPTARQMPFHLLMLDDIGNRHTKVSLLTHLAWYLTREDGRDIKEDVLVAEALKRGIVADDFEARVIIKGAVYRVPNTVWVGSFFYSRPGFLQLESRRKYERKDGKLVPVQRVEQHFNPAR